MKHKVSELEGALLDAAVAKAERLRHIDVDDSPHTGWYELPNGAVIGVRDYAPSTDWSLGGPIIEREQIAVAYHPLVEHWAACGNGHRWLGLMNATGPTPLIAAMRAYVASKLGEEVELP